MKPLGTLWESKMVESCLPIPESHHCTACAFSHPTTWWRSPTSGILYCSWRRCSRQGEIVDCRPVFGKQLLRVKSYGICPTTTNTTCTTSTGTWPGLAPPHSAVATQVPSTVLTSLPPSEPWRRKRLQWASADRRLSSSTTPRSSSRCPTLATLHHLEAQYLLLGPEID